MSVVSRAVFLCIGLSVVSLPALAQDAPALVFDEVPAGPPLTSEEAAMLGQALTWDPNPASAPAKSLRKPKLKDPEGLGVSRNDGPGGTTVVVKQPLPWDAKVGADLGLASDRSSDYKPTLPRARLRDGNAGVAWASVGVTDYASVDARVDPANDSGKLGGTLKHTMPLGQNYSLSLQNSASVTEISQTPVAAGPNGLPLMTLPQDAVTGPSQIWGNEQRARFNILSTGTTLGAGLATTSADPVTHNSLTAEQKLYGPLRVTTSVNDLGQATGSKSITAGFKLNW